MKVRFATATDVDSIASLHVRSWQVAYRGLIPDETLDNLDVADRADRWRTNIAQGEQDVFVATVHSVIRGFSSLEPARDESESPEAVAEISSIYVDSDYWRKGLGRSLCASMFERATERAFQEIVLWVLEGNHVARRFYGRVGFQQNGASGKTRGFGGGVELAEIRYRLKLCTVKDREDPLQKSGHILYTSTPVIGPTPNGRAQSFHRTIWRKEIQTFRITLGARLPLGSTPQMVWLSGTR